MKLFLKNNIRLMVFLCLGLVFLILALCVKWENTDFLTIIYIPMQAIGDYIRYDLGNTVDGWAFYIFLGLLPLVYPIVKIIKTRKFYWVSLGWVVLSVFGYVMLYFFINPHLLNNNLIQSAGDFNQIALIGFEVTYFILFLMCFLLELGGLLKSNPEKSYLLAKIAIDTLILILIFNFFFLEVISTKAAFENIAEAAAVFNNLNKELNLFEVIFSLIIKFVTLSLTVLLFIKCCCFIDGLNNNALNLDNLIPLNKLIKFAKLTVLITLGAAAADNIISLALCKWLLNANYHIEVPLISLIAICFVIIFSEILMRAIKLNEEQKLVI